MASNKSGGRIVIIVVVVLALAVGGYFIFRPKNKKKYKTSPVTRGEILSQVSATGTLNPIDEVVVGSQVSGILDTVLVDYNDQVKAGQVLARIDPRNYQSALSQADANLTSARVSLEQAQRDYYHGETLYQAKLISGDQWVQTKTTYELAQTKVTQAQANYDQAQTNLAYTTISSPMTGLVIARKVQNGQTVAASFSAPELFDIADLSRMQVEVSIQEADVGKLDTGMLATFKVDAYPDQTFEGTLVQIRNDPIVSSNVVTYVGIVHVANPDFLLKPGMTADVKIVVTDVKNVLLVPSAALSSKLASTIGIVQPRTGAGTGSASAARSGAGTPGAQGGQAVNQTRAGGSSGSPSGSAMSGLPRSRRESLPAGAGPAAESGTATIQVVRKTQTVYVLEKGVPTPHQVQVGANDSYNTEITSGLKEGDLVITGLDTGHVNPFAAQTQNRPPGGGIGR